MVKFTQQTKNFFQNFEPFVCLIFLPKKENITLYDCFDLYTEGEILDGDNQYEMKKLIE